jgi:hypothetical protein
MLETTVKEAFEKVGAGFDLPFHVNLIVYKTREEASKALGREVKPHEFAFASYDNGNSSITYIDENWPLQNHSSKKECLEGVLAEDFGHLQYDGTHEEMTAIDVHPELYLHVYQFWAVSNGVEAGFGPQLLEFYRIAATETKAIPGAGVNEVIGVFPALAALSEKYDMKQIIAKYMDSLPLEVRKEAENYSFLLNPKSYQNEERLLRCWGSTKC